MCFKYIDLSTSNIYASDNKYQILSMNTKREYLKSFINIWRKYMHDTAWNPSSIFVHTMEEYVKIS